MKLEDIKKEMPKTPEMIHNRIQDEIRKQMENEQNQRRNFVHGKWILLF